MGNAAPQRQPEGRVILSDGGILTYDEPLTAAELMLEHPQHVVEFQPIASVRKPAPLPADQKLEIRKTYLMLRIRKGKPIQFSSDEAKKILANTNAALKSNALLSFTGILPLVARVIPEIGGRNAAAEKNRCLNEREKEAAEEDSKLDCLNSNIKTRPLII